jgi:mannose-6-phosphate isomerase-like protein (cupin superfamily)
MENIKSENSQFSFLSGKVLKQSLPPLSGPPGPAAPALKRLLLPQGELAQLYDSEEGIRYIAAIELRAGGIRGNHYHKVKEELLYMIEGELLLVVEDPESHARASIPLRRGDLAFIRTGIAHALQPAGPGRAIEFSAARFDPSDIYKFPLI